MDVNENRKKSGKWLLEVFGTLFFRYDRSKFRDIIAITMVPCHFALGELETVEKVPRLIVSFIRLRLRDTTNFLSFNCLYGEYSE